MPFVTVCCKLPNGIVLDLDVAKPLGDKGQLMAIPSERRVTLNGGNSSGVVGGFGFTEVDEEFWNAWIATHKDFSPVTQGLIYATPKAKDASQEAANRAETKSGFEGMNPENPMPGVQKMDPEK